MIISVSFVNKSNKYMNLLLLLLVSDFAKFFGHRSLKIFILFHFMLLENFINLIDGILQITVEIKVEFGDHHLIISYMNSILILKVLFKVLRG